jgi:AraC-like DNA-binding protein
MGDERRLGRFATLREDRGNIRRYSVAADFGTGTVIQCILNEGLELYFFDYEVKHNGPIGGFNAEDTLEIFYCVEGDVRLEYSPGCYRLTGNTMGIYDFASCPRAIRFESHRFIGISLLLDGVAADETINRYIGEASIRIARMRELVARKKDVFICFGNQEIRKVFLSIAENPFDYDIDFLRLKAMELIMISGKSLDDLLAEHPTAQRRELNLRRFDKAIRYMEQNLASTLTIGGIAREAGVSTTKLQGLFLDFCGQSVYRHLRSMRLNRAQQLLRQGKLSIADVAMAVGWQNPSKFSAAYKKEYGTTPQQFQGGR